MNPKIKRLWKNDYAFRQRVKNFFSYKYLVKKTEGDIGKDHQAIKIAKEKRDLLKEEILRIIRKKE